MRSLIQICVVLLISCVLHAQNIKDIQYFDLNEGLEESDILFCLRDDFGFFYVFTPNFIQRFDGEKFVSLDISILKENKLKIENLRAVSSFNGEIHLMDSGDQKKFFSIPSGSLKVNATEFPDNIAKAKVYISQENLFLLTLVKDAKTQIHILNNSLNKIEDIGFDQNLDVHSIFRKDSDIYLHCVNNSNYHFNPKSNSLKRLPEDGPLFLNAKNALFVFAKKKIKVLEQDSFRVVFDKIVDNEFPIIIREDKIGNVLVAYSSKIRNVESLYIIDTVYNISSQNQLRDVGKVASDFCADDFSSSIMLATYKGMYTLNVGEAGFKSAAKFPNLQPGEFGNIITGLTFDNNNLLHFAKERIGYFTMDTSGSIVEPFRKQYSKSYFYRNQKVYFDSISNNVYSYSYYIDDNFANLYRYNPDSKSLDIDVLPFRLQDAIVDNSDFLLLIGNNLASDGIVASFDYSKTGYEVIVQPDFLKAKHTRCIAKDELNNTYWIGTQNGLFLVDEDFNLVEEYSQNITVKNRYLKFDHIRTINLIDTKIFVGTRGGGLYIIDRSTGNITHQLNESNGLADNNAISLIEDDAGNYWIGTFNGLSVLNSDLEFKRNFYFQDGLSDKEFNTKSVTKSTDGQLYFGTINGFTIVDPKIALERKTTAGVFVEEIVATVGEKFEFISNDDYYLDLNGIKENLRFKFNFPDFKERKFGNTANDLNIELPEGGEYTVLYDGLIFSNLPKTEFPIKISLDNYSKPLEFMVNNTRNYAEILKYLLFVISVILAALLISKYFIRKNREEEEEKTQLNRKISELQLSSLQSQMNPHFIFNALGAIQYFIQTKETDKADEYLSDFAKLIRSILESSKSKYTSVKEEIEMLKIYVRLEQVRFEDMFQYEFVIDQSIDSEFSIPPMLVQPFIENAINHGINNLKDREGKLLIEFKKINSNTIHCIVMDNGIGRKAASKISMKNHKSRGMQIVNERIQTINSSNVLKLDIDIQDLVDADNVVGTKVTLEIQEL